MRLWNCSSKIDGQKLTGTGKAEFFDPNMPSEFPVPAFGAHDLEPPANPDVFAHRAC